MDKSRGSSSEAISGSKRRLDKSPVVGADLEYEASLRSHLEAEHADREQVACEREAWATGPEWLQQEERGRSLVGSSSLASGSGTGAVLVANPWEVAAAGVRRVLLHIFLARYLLRVVRLRSLAFLLAFLVSGMALGCPLATTMRALPLTSLRSAASLLPPLAPSPRAGAMNRIKPPPFVHYGLGLPGCSFFVVDGEQPRVDTAPALSNVAIISMQGQKITPQVLREGLRVWAVDGWECEMHQISDFEFFVVFPSSESLRMIASCTSFTLPLNQLVISIKAATNGSKSVGQLSEVWVLVEDVPAEFRSVPFLMVFGILLGKPIEVDGESLARLGYVRLKLWCVDPVCLHGPDDVFPPSARFRLQFRLEGAEAFQDPPPPPAPSHYVKRNDG
ncbi:hypothetical protein D1007_39889 [Hordeum vulgare]|nr:hypothetical protein D1007_39889 [Hordeum vulgare]